MKLQQLHQFVVLSEVLSFRKAAVRLHMTQPPLSTSIRNLEVELGVKLFERLTTGLRITSAGHELLIYARRTLLNARRLQERAKAAAQGDVGTLRVDFVVSSTVGVLQRTISKFRARHPGVSLQLQERSTDSIIAALNDFRIDIGIIRYPVVVPRTLVLYPIEENSFVAVLPLDHPLAKRSWLRLEALRDEPFVFFSKQDASTSHATTLIACQKAGFTPNIVQQVVNAPTLIALVECGLGVALVPDIYEHLGQRAVTFKKIIGMSDHRTGLAIACRKDEVDERLIVNFRNAAVELSSLPEAG